MKSGIQKVKEWLINNTTNKCQRRLSINTHINKLKQNIKLIQRRVVIPTEFWWRLLRILHLGIDKN